MDENSLPMPFAGGINSAQVQTMDTNGDGSEELVIWDINARNILVLKTENGKYKSLSLMPYYFPEDINGFLVLADFDGDGRKDLFTSSPFGIKAYRNISPAGAAFPQWEVAEEYLRLDNGSNLQANNLDIPVIQDIDGDGDLDLVTFNFASGDYLEFYRNTSMERNGSPDIDGFSPPVVRWGNFEFCGCDQFSFGQTCSGNPISRMAPKEEDKKTQHAGGHSLLLQDFNGDGILDMVMGQDECHTLYYLPNEGSSIDPDFNQFSKNLPLLGDLPEFPIFHAAQTLPNGDLVISTNTSSTSITSGANFGQSLYLYPQEGGFSLSTNRFLQEDMVDLGENSRPYFRGNRNNGTLIVTANTTAQGQVTGKAFRFDLTEEGLELVDSDYLNLSSFYRPSVP